MKPTYTLEGYTQLSTETIDWVINKSGDDDDACGTLVLSVLSCEETEAWDICDKIWDKYGRV